MSFFDWLGIGILLIVFICICVVLVIGVVALLLGFGITNGPYHTFIQSNILEKKQKPLIFDEILKMFHLR